MEPSVIRYSVEMAANTPTCRAQGRDQGLATVYVVKVRDNAFEAISGNQHREKSVLYIGMIFMQRTGLYVHARAKL